MGEDAGFWVGLAITSVCAWILKLNACAMQQKMIGERMGGSEAIRSASAKVVATTMTKAEASVADRVTTRTQCCSQCQRDQRPRPQI